MIEKQEIEDKINLKEIYGKVCMLSTEEFIRENQVKKEGLTTEEVNQNQIRYGRNQMKQAKPKKWYWYLWKSFLSPFNLILLGITFVLIYTDVVLQQTPSLANIFVVIALMMISTFLEFFEVYKSNKAAEKLKKLVAVKVNVLREGKEIPVYLEEVTIGDMVLLSAGDLIPADLRIIEQKDLYVVQSSLTGESEAVKKLASTENKTIEQIEDITNLDNICFMGTNVMSGTAKGIVFQIADNTYFGRVAQSLEQGKPKTSFQKGIESISKLLVRFMLVLIPITFLINAWKHDNLTAFTFAVAIAIGITPLLLPVLLASSLAKGAMNMSKKKTIVKKLDSIQSFGAMNILGTDKTGTLTEDKIVLEKYLNLQEEEDEEILKIAFLNSYFQTGLRGNIDEAVIARVKKEGLEQFAKVYQKIDEIPFDFSRRRLSVILEKDQNIQMITKGAVEEILSICSYLQEEKKQRALTNEDRQKIKKMTKKLNEQGLRVIAIAVKEIEGKLSSYTKKEEEKMTLVRIYWVFRPTKRKCKR